VKRHLLVLSIHWAVNLRQEKLHRLQTAGMGGHHKQRVARLVGAELVRASQKNAAGQLILQSSPSYTNVQKENKTIHPVILHSLS